MTVRFLRSAVCAMLLAAAGSAAAADEVKFEFHGFVGASVYSENASFNNNGGQAAWVVTNEPTTDKGVVGGDVRQTRLNFSLTGPQLFDGGTARAFAEIDFFGGNTAGGFGDISIAPRLRVAFAELKLAKTGTVIRAGQDHDLVLGLILPATAGHVAFPLSYQSGTIGWRRPQIAAYQTIPAGPNFKVELAAAVGRSGWTGATGTEERLGMASGLPSFEGRAKLQHKIFEVFAAAHWSQIDASGQGSEVIVLPTTPPTNTGVDAKLTTTAFNVGGKASYMGATVQGSFYTGKNLGPLAGNLLQWQSQAAIAAAKLAGRSADVSEVGGWIQAGYNILPELSVWALTGFANPNDKDLIDDGLTRSRNQTSSFLVRYQNKGYTAGLEYTLYRTGYTNVADGPLKANQLMLSGMYFF